MKTSIIFFLSITSAVAGTRDDFSCTLTQMIESIDGQMKARNRYPVLKKSFPSQGFGRYEEIFSDPADPIGKKFRIEAKLERGKQGQWKVSQQLYHVLTEGEREGKEIAGSLSAIEVIRTAEQVHRGVPKSEYRLQCLVKAVVDESPLFAHNLETEMTLDVNGEAVDISKRSQMAAIHIPYSPVFIQKSNRLDPTIFNREVDPDPRSAVKPTTVTESYSVGSRAPASQKTEESSWRDVWPFRLMKKSNPAPVQPMLGQAARLAHQPVQLESTREENEYRKKVSPSRSSVSSRVSAPVPLVLAPKHYQRELKAYAKTQPINNAVSRKPASEKEYLGIRPAVVNGVPSVPTPLIRIWGQFGK